MTCNSRLPRGSPPVGLMRYRAGHMQRPCGPCGSSMREPKDPAAFKSMDELREHLTSRQPRSSLTFVGLLDFMSKANNSVDLAPSTSAWTSASTLEVVQGVISRSLAKGYRDFVRAAGAAIRHRLSRNGRDEEDESLWPQIDPTKYRQLEPLMAGVLSMRSLRKAAFRYPPLLEMDPAELAVRLVALKQLLEGCDVPLLVEREPALFLQGSQQEVAQRVQQGMGLLRAGLAGADIYQVVMLDPALLFMPELERGLREMRDLWDVDEACLADSDPQMLALAVRALSVTGLPGGI